MSGERCDRCDRCDRVECRRAPTLEAMQGKRASLSDWSLDRALDAAERDCAAHAVDWRDRAHAERDRADRAEAEIRRFRRNPYDGLATDLSEDEGRLVVALATLIRVGWDGEEQSEDGKRKEVAADGKRALDRMVQAARSALLWRARVEPLIADLLGEMRAVVTYHDRRAAGGQVTGPSSMGRMAAVGPGVVRAFREYLERFATDDGKEQG